MAPDSKNQPAPSSARNSAFDDLFEITVDAAIKAFVLVILGNVAVQLVGSVAGRMIPSAPPGFASGMEAPSAWIVWWTAIKGIKFYIAFFVLFFLGVRARFIAGEIPTGEQAKGADRWERVRRRFADNWFVSLVGNAFVAMALASVVLAISNFTVWYWFWHWVGGLIPLESILGERWANRLQPWWDWYDHNQLKFNFWLIYVGAVADDMGLPNLKSLGRRAWRRWSRPRTQLAPVVAADNPPDNS